jgi:hypothetical protein
LVSEQSVVCVAVVHCAQLPLPSQMWAPPSPVHCVPLDAFIVPHMPASHVAVTHVVVGIGQLAGIVQMPLPELELELEPEVELPVVPPVPEELELAVAPLVLEDLCDDVEPLPPVPSTSFESW